MQQLVLSLIATFLKEKRDMHFVLNRPDGIRNLLVKIMKICNKIPMFLQESALV